MKITATIICKNEREHIVDCLDSLREVDTVVLCDTGSTDDTLARARVARPTGLVITHFPWVDHFADARNAALAAAEGDWCIVIDCDEVLAPGSVAKLKEAIKNNPEATTLRFLCRSKSHPNQVHYMIRAHKRTPEIQWRGRIHEALSSDSTQVAEGCEIIYGYSVAHADDPDRALRILQQDYDAAVQSGGAPEPRNLYYLAREHIYRKDFPKAIPLLEARVATIGFRPECADAYLYLSTCYWLTGQGDKAREACMKSLIMAPDCKEALEFMATMSFPEQAKVWAKFATTATNEGVLFIRKP